MVFRNLAAKTAMLAAAASIVAVAVTDPANATLAIQLQSGSTIYSQTGPSPLVMVQSIGNFTTTVNTGTSTSLPALDLSSVDIASAGGGSLVVTLSADGFTTPTGLTNWLSQFSGNFVSGTATVTLQTYLDSSNTLMGTGTLIHTLTAAGTPFALSVVGNAVAGAPFALTEVLTIVTTGPSHLSLDASIASVPEPGSLALVGVALSGLGALSRRRRRTVAAPH